MAKLRHIALVVKDLEQSANFYMRSFGMQRSELQEGPTARRIYLSDGVVNLALLQYKGETGSGLKNADSYVGIHHFGFQCDDIENQQKRIEGAGGKFFFDLGDPDDDDFERKFRDPNGIIFDINYKGWALTKSKLKSKTSSGQKAKGNAKRTMTAKARTATGKKAKAKKRR